MVRLTKRAQQAIKTKNQIYDSFLELIQKEEFEDLTIEKICKKAKVAVGTFYHYYKTKNDIMEEVFLRGDEYFKDSITNKQINGDTASEQIINFFEHFARFHANNGIDFNKAIYNTRNKSFVSGNRLMGTILHEIVCSGVEAKQLSDRLTTQEMTRMLFTVARGVVFDWCIKDGAFSLEKVMKQYMHTMVCTMKI